MNRLIAFVGTAFFALAIPSFASAQNTAGCYSAFMKNDYVTAFRECQIPAKQGDAHSQFNLGVMYDNGQGVAQSYSEAVKWYRKAADQGEASAQFNLGNMYDIGRGVAHSDTEALKWYRKAADQGDASAQFNLGYMYINGQGVAQSDTESAKWYRKAADQGNAKAQSNLGLSYAKGEGVPENYVEAYRWTSLAAASGDQVAIKNLKIIKGWMTPSQIAEDPKLAAGGKIAAQAIGWSAVSRSDVKRLQKALNDLGFSVGSADGIPGQRTKSALATFQRIKGLSVGAPDTATLSALGVK